MRPVEVLVHGRLEIATKCGAKRRGHVENGNPLCEFGLGIPTPQHVEQDWEEGRFEESHEETKGVELCMTA